MDISVDKRFYLYGQVVNGLIANSGLPSDEAVRPVAKRARALVNEIELAEKEYLAQQAPAPKPKAKAKEQANVAA